MLRQDVDEEDFRTEIFSLRKHISRVCGENNILKVKIRKLQDEMIKRDKQLDEFLHSKRLFGLPKNLQDKGASVLMNLKVKNDNLEQLLLEKEMMVKRLQNNLQTAKLYSANSFNKKFASKAIECNLLGDNKFEYLEEGRMNTKLELHMPNFDKGEFGWTEENCSSKRANSAESRFLKDINLDLKKTTKPSYYFESQYERSHMETKASKSEGTLRTLSNEYISMVNRWSKSYGQKKESKFEKNEVEGYSNPKFKKILRTIEELIGQGRNSNYSRITTRDESSQFPVEGPELLHSLVDDQNHETLILRRIASENGSLDTGRILDEQPPSILHEILVLDQSDPEATSVSEKIDTMEKYENQTKENMTTLQNELPHEEIKQLHGYLLDMLSQVDCLKDTISQMKADQEKTESDLKSKDESIVKLAKEIEQLRELRSASRNEMEKLSNKYVELPEQDNALIESYELMEKATQQNIKKISGKMQHLKDSKSKSSISSDTEPKSTRSSSKNSRPEKWKNTEKIKKKTDRKLRGISHSKRVFGLGNGDVIEVPYYRCGFAAGSENVSTMNEFDELD